MARSGPEKRRRRRWRRLPPDLRREILELAKQGLSGREIGERLTLGQGSVRGVLQPLGGVITPEMWLRRSPRHLSLEERIEIHAKLAQAWSLTAIGRSLGRAPSTVSREVEANGGRRHYRPVAAHRGAEQRARRPKATKLAANPELRAQVVAGLERLWSPEQIARRLRTSFPHRPEMWVSHETIYASLFVQGRGELRRELAACLRSGRATRLPRGRLERRGRIAGMIPISERPAEVEDRAVPGHWEGDLIIGKAGRSAIGTLVERSTRFVMLLHLPVDRSAASVRSAMASTIQGLPAALVRSVTWDRGAEMAEHAALRIETGIDVYFADPHSPWQRGSNENTNGLLRQYFPKGTDLSVHSPERLQEVADSLNGRPRQTLDWQTPAERLDQVLASTP